MTLYSDFAARRTGQIVADCAAVLGIVAFIVLGVTLHGAIMSLQAVGMRLADAGTSFESTMTEISGRLSQVPLIGSGISDPFDEAAGAGSTLQGVGLAQQQATEQVAVAAAVAVAVIPIVAILLGWLIPRLRFVRRSAWARAASASPEGLDLLACRALVSRRIPDVQAAHPDAAGGWRRNDPDAVAALAILELRACGVRPAGAAVLTEA